MSLIMMEETMKIPEPIMEPATNNVASRRPSDFLSFSTEINPRCLKVQKPQLPHRVLLRMPNNLDH